MNKPFSDPLSDLVRSCPVESPTGQDITGQDITEEPPNPLSGGTVEERAERARNGSRRQRDLEALADVQRVPIPDDVEQDDSVVTIWAAALDSLRARDSVTAAAAVENWLDPLTVLGVSDDHIVVTGHPRNVDWTRKRYAATLSVLVRPDFAGVLICDGGGA